MQKLLYQFGPAILLLPLFLSIRYYKRFPAVLKNITLYMIVSAAVQLLSYIVWQLHMKTLPILHVYIIFEYLILLSFYYSTLKDFLPRAVFGAALVVPVFFIADTLFIENINSYNTYARSTEALIMIFFAMAWYVKLVSEKSGNALLDSAIKFINSGFLIYFSGSVMLFSFANYISTLAAKFSFSIWTIHTLLAITLYLLIAAGLWKYRKR